MEFVEIELSIAPYTGALSTVEGCVNKAIEELSQNQNERLTQSYDVWSKVQQVITKLEGYLENKEPFTIALDDPSGNSYIENLCAPLKDPKITMKLYDRTREQDISLGLTTAEQLEQEDEKAANEEAEKQKEEENNADIAHEVHTFFGNCSRCNVPCDTKMHMLGKIFFYFIIYKSFTMSFLLSNLDIPHFKEVIIMSTNCDDCGYKNNEVKVGGAVSLQGKKIILNVTERDDLSRDVLKVKNTERYKERESSYIYNMRVEIVSGTELSPAPPSLSSNLI